MARNPYYDTQTQNFFKEVIETESTSRLKAFARWRGQPRYKPTQFEVMKKKLEETRHSDALLERLPPICAERRFGRPKVDFNEPPNFDKTDLKRDKEFFVDMRPVSPLAKNTLYEGFTKEGKGRHIYLRQRYDKNPETKFPFPSCSSWDYGWRLGDMMKKDELKHPKHGRQGIVEHSFYTRNGPLSSCSSVH